VISEIQGYHRELSKSMNAKINRVRFLNKFYLFSGLSKMSGNAKTFDINKSEAIDILDCKSDWQVCLLNFTYKNKVPEYFIFQAHASSYHIDDDYIDKLLDD
jgi:hypothetical protein